MIKILIVDDDVSKANKIRDVASSFLGGSEFEISTTGTITDAAPFLRSTLFDLVVLDLNIPIRADEEPRSDGGIRLLKELRRRKEWKRPTHILGLTAFDNLAKECESEFDGDLWHIVHYDPSSDSWEERLGRKLVHIVETHSARRDGYSCDLAVITALHEIELESVLELPGNWQKKPIDGDETIYHVGSFTRDDKKLSVVAASATEMGMPAAAALTMKIIENFRPRYVVMTGIAAGVKGSFGDILIADQSWDYGSGKNKFIKRRGSIFEPAPVAIPLSPLLKAKVSYFLMSKKTVREIREGWTRSQVPTELKARLGPIASGAAVLENKPLIDEIVEHNRKLIGVEMETYGVFVAARASKAPRPDAMSIKSICDFGDANKNDEYQAYAAYTSSKFLYEFALSELCDIEHNIP
ncbi:hypothetical protein JRI60_41810 [Archangium violaceum]|uniref:phosphorylase family protein n=1 Tax=Archangium violaceum TaxID=83451 RepID=UPI001950E658|nr:hypothetical protein [Archangium violaceum]QRN95534.1 hypothetical protein JRI60_41810 [Archangium violaceum]